MIREQDYEPFANLLALLSEMAVRSRTISAETIEGYFQALEDLPFEAINRHAMLAVRTNGGHFPSVAELAGEEDPEIEAQKAFEDISRLVCSFVGMGFGETSMTAIQIKLANEDKEDLIPLVRTWGAEIAYGTNPTATRAQFIRAYKADTTKRRKELIAQRLNLLPEGQRKELKEWTGKIAKKSA